MLLTQISKWPWKRWGIRTVAFRGLLVFCLCFSCIGCHSETPPDPTPWPEVYSNKLISGGISDITSVVFTPDSKELLVVSGNGEIKQFDVHSRKIKKTFHAKKYLKRIELSPKGNILYGVRKSYSDIYRFDLTAGKPLSQLETPGNAKTTKSASSSEDRFEPVSLALSSDGKTLAAGCINHIVPLWDITTGKRTHVLYGHSNSVSSVSFSPDNSTLATVSGSQSPGTVVLWDVKSGKRKKTITDGITEYAHVDFVAFLSNDCLVAGTRSNVSGSGVDKKYNGVSLKVWSASSGKVLQTLTGHFHKIVAVVALSKEKLLTISWDRTIRLWDLKTGGHRIYQVNHDDAIVEILSMALSPDHKYLAVGFLGSESYCKLWKLSELFPGGIKEGN